MGGEGEGEGDAARNDEDPDPSVDQVMSEVHLGCPPRFSGPYTSHFTFRAPPSPFSSEPYALKERNEGLSNRDDASRRQMPTLDEDGDLLLTRQTKTSPSYGMTIRHMIMSSIPSVGLQVWKGALVLADFALHMACTSPVINDIIALELGAGTGIVGLLLARFARTVFLTDFDDEVLHNCAKNVDLNYAMFKHHGTSVYVRKLDWKSSWPPPAIEDHEFPSQGRYIYSWTTNEAKQAEEASLLLAADVIYNDDLTDSFFDTLKALMSRGVKKVLYMALEKRYNFSLGDLDVVANGYAHFRSYLKVEEECRGSKDASASFVGKRVDLEQIPQYIKEYDRGKDLEIWQIEYVSSGYN